MQELIKKTRNYLKQEQIDYLLVNSTNEFLAEYNPLDKNSRYYLTGFSGSTGEALISADNIWLFVDGRYHAQADLEVDAKLVKVVKLQIGDRLIEKIAETLKNDSILGIVSKKNSQFRYERLKEFLTFKNIKMKLLENDILEQKCHLKKQEITEIPIDLTGFSAIQKIDKLTNNLKNDEAILITNLEEVSYIYNLRNFQKTNACSIDAKAFLTKDRAILFKDDTLKYFEKVIIKSEDIKTVYVDKMTINAYDFSLVKHKAKDYNPHFEKSIKTENELKHYKDAFNRTDSALLATRKFIEENENISEFDICKNLEENFIKHGALSQSFKSIVAKDENSALAHYSKSSKKEIMKNGSIVLIDCGGYYKGGLATDITRVFVKGEASKKQKEVYTKVLKAFLHAFNKELKPVTTGYEIDKVARDLLKEIAPEGFEFSHGLGHGIGISVHENPPRLSNADCSKTILEENMCFTIEPGLYKSNFGGIRLENSCYIKNNKIHSFSNMCYEKKLIDFDMLTEQEKKWLNNFEVK